MTGQYRTFSSLSDNSPTASTDATSKPRILQFGLRLFIGGPKGGNASANMVTSGKWPHIRIRSRSGHNVLFNDPIPSIPAAYMARDEMQDQRSQRDMADIPSSDPHPTELYRIRTQARTPHKPKVISKRQIFCFGPGIKTRPAKRKLRGCVVSVILLVILLSTYLVLVFTSDKMKEEFHVIMILGIMSCTIYFGHSFIRLVMVASRPLHIQDISQQVMKRARRPRYAQPEQPIPVNFGEDVEAALSRNGGSVGGFKPIATPPPAYGALGNNVKINPKISYWHRVQLPTRGHDLHDNVDESLSTTDNRPPSYISGGDVRYSVNIQSQV